MLISVINRLRVIPKFFPFLRNMSRSSCGKKDDPPCPPYEPPKPPFDCASWDIKRPVTGPKPVEHCHTKTNDSKSKLIEGVCAQPLSPGQPLFNKPECCNAICPDLLPRYDDMYYKISDKAKRIYRQTWVECPPPTPKTKRGYCYDDDAYPPMERRPRLVRPQTACDTVRKNRCQKNLKCIKIILPGCRSLRNTYNCRAERNERPKCSGKRCAPYPSYSECARVKKGEDQWDECKCLKSHSSCVIWSEIEKAVRLGLMKKIIKK